MASKAAATTTQDSTSTDVAVRNGFSTEELRGIQSFADVQALFAEHNMEVVDAAEEIGDGFALTDNKDQFIGRQMMILSWVFAPGDFKDEHGNPTEFTALRFVVQESNGSVGKYVITDGGTGIYKQLREYTDRTGVTGGMFVKKGLRKSEYANEYRDNNVTHYLDLSK
jgi:hypothetical protein